MVSKFTDLTKGTMFPRDHHVLTLSLGIFN